MEKIYRDDSELFALMKAELTTCVVGDVMDKMGLRRQFLPPEVRPLSPDMVLAGRALPVLEADYYSDSSDSRGPLAKRGFGLMFEALDDLKPNEVYIASGTTGAYAMWGELMATRARMLGAAGAIINGFSRDTKGVLEMGFPTFSRGSYGQDQGVRGKVVDFRLPIEVGAARVEPGAILFGDIDGVLVIPREAEADVIAGAIEKVRGEKKVAEAIRAGMSTVEAYAKFGIM
ncbi:RraA family protein [Arvimicrobium flavum]|uniref:RraA family protein n=1 Tax=Arvimicrobium flavum TaxID=3393320 RepID=UPI00237AB6D7|nr:RraA family protein [Mesorhizobium shangrilense]